MMSISGVELKENKWRKKKIVREKEKENKK